MVLQFSKLFYSKISSGLLRQDLQSSYSFGFGKIQNVGILELFEEKISASLEKDFIYIYIYI